MLTKSLDAVRAFSTCIDSNVQGPEMYKDIDKKKPFDI